MSARPFGGFFDAAAAAHLWRRAGFGANRATLERSREQGLEATLGELLARRQHDPDLLHGVRPLLALEDVSALQFWWMALILADRSPLVERVALLWHDHFATSHDKVGDVRLMHGQIELFRLAGLGDFRLLLHQLARDPAMLTWLDGNQNRKGAPNENFAREVLELFALGRGNYGERDVREAARAFTGWGVEGRRFVLRAAHHDDGPKEVLGRRGALDGDDVLDTILAHPSCARHVARKLLEEFALPRPAAAEIDTWAGVLVQEDWSVERTLAHLFRSEYFFSPAVRRSRIAAPVELVARTALTLGAKLPPARAARAAASMSQALLRPPSVKGWDGECTWIHAGSWIARTNFFIALCYGDGSGGARTEVDLAGAAGTAREAAGAARALRELLLPDVADPALEAQLVAAAQAAPSLDEGLRRIAALLLTSPEYQLT